MKSLCSWALKNLGLNETNKKRIASGRGPRLIVEAMRNFPGHAGIVEEACGYVEWPKETALLPLQPEQQNSSRVMQIK